MLEPISLLPGIYTEASDRTVINRYKDGLNWRFFKGNGQKIGGWVTQIAQTFSGICRSSASWTTLSYQRLIGLGTNAKLYLSDSATYFDITPVDATGTLAADPFTTVNGSKTIIVADVTHGRNVGDYVAFTGATVVGGLDLNGEHYVDVVIDNDHYSFQMPNAANAGATGGGAAVDFVYDIHSGYASSVIGSGWGAGGWGIGTWGDPRISNVLTLARIWSLANWGEDLIASPVDGPVYVWVASGGTNTRAVVISTAPAQNRKILVSDQLRILISLGSHDGTSADPMLIRWSDSENYNDFTPSPTNLAGDKRLDGGNQIITGVITRGEIAVFTDTQVWSMALSGDDNVFTFLSKGQTVGLLSPNAACDVNGVIYAMGNGNFYTYDGAVKILPCDVHSRIFGNINLQQAAKVQVRRSKTKSEILIFWPSAGSDEIDLCAGYNYDDGNWWLGNVARTSWLDESPFFNVPMATSATTDALGYPAGIMYLQETGTDADGAPLPYFAETWDMEIGASSNGLTGSSTGAGEVIDKVTRLFPDFKRLAGRHKVTLKGRKYPQDKQFSSAPGYFYPGKPRVDLHLRARQMSMRIESNQLGADIEIGSWRKDSRAQGHN